MAARFTEADVRRLNAKARGEASAATPSRSSHEQAFDRQLADADLPPHEIEQCLVPGRKWRSDYVWREQRVVVEVDGTIASGQGRHQTESGVTEDCTKALRLAVLGWLPVRVTGTMIGSGEAIELVSRLLGRIDTDRAEHG